MLNTMKELKKEKKKTKKKKSKTGEKEFRHNLKKKTEKKKKKKKIQVAHWTDRMATVESGGLETRNALPGLGGQEGAKKEEKRTPKLSAWDIMTWVSAIE